MSENPNLKSIRKRKVKSLPLQTFLIFAFSLLLFLIGIQNSNSYIFDEYHYVPNAQTLIEKQYDSNGIHPPLGKYLIATSILIAGDSPFGWRAGSACFGAGLLAILFLIAVHILKDQCKALVTVILCFSNCMLWVMARIAMLDIFMLFFGFLGIYLILIFKKKDGILHNKFVF